MTTNAGKKWAAGLAALTGLGLTIWGGVAVTPAAAQVPAPIMGRAMKHNERHPELRRALKNLNQAKANLQRAKHDFAGHREQALDLVQKAIDQTQQALADDHK